MNNVDNLEAIKASQIEILKKEKAKQEIGKFLNNTYRVDGMSIAYVDVNFNGNGYIIVECSFDKFNYPIKLNVDSNTETYLGMSYHLQSNYGYILHEICDITLKDKIVDVDNITGTVKSIEYIAD